METPIDPLVADMVKKLDEGLREEFEERAAIMEFEGKMPCAHAECLALLNVLHRHPSVLTGVNVLKMEMKGKTQWLLTTDPDLARRQLADVDGTRIETHVVDLAAVVREEYGGVAMLTTIISSSGRTG